MKARTYFVILSVLIFFNLKQSYAQMQDVEQIKIFGSRLKTPIVIDVKTARSYIYFNVINKSQFIYDFEIKFRDFSNLSPRVFEKKTTLLPGNNRLFSFKIVDPQQPPTLSYQTRFYMSGSNTVGEKFNLYLIPIGKNKIVKLQSIQTGNLTKLIMNQFEINQGDTVYSARKGTVTALPDNSVELDRLINNSVEIRHNDGTVGVYLGVDPSIKLIRIGQTVYPGQPLGLVSSGKLLIFKVFEIQNEGNVNAIDISYSGDNNQVLDSKDIMGTKVSYSPEIIKKEMTKKELKKYENGSLFSK